MTPVELVLSKVSGLRRNGRGWQACCPAHDDRRPSLSIAEGRDGRALLRCHAGCSAERVVSALGLGLGDLMPAHAAAADNTPRNWRPRTVSSTSTASAGPKTYPTPRDAAAELERQHGPRSAWWTYTDANDEPVGVIVRWEFPEGGKEIRPVSRQGDRWWIAGMPAPRPLYRLPELAGARRIYVTEGEKTADAACSVGLIATTSPHGSESADKADWKPLAGREVVILPDNDDAGRRYANDVVRLVAKLTPAPVVKIIDLPSLPPNGDMVEYAEARRAAGLDNDAIRAEIEELADATESIEPDAHGIAGTPVLVRLADVKPESIRWLWRNRIALGKLTLIAGDPGLGKSLLTLDMAARVSRGIPWPDAPAIPNPAGGVVALSAEDGLADTIRPRLDAAGADVSRISALQAVKHRDPDSGKELSTPFCLTGDLPALEQAIEQTSGCRLLIIDPITAYLGRTDSHRNAELRGVLAPLSELAGRHRVAVVAVTHLRKADGPAVYRAMGSLAFTAAARAVWAVTKDKDDPRRRLMLPVKNNIAGDVLGLAYTIGPGDPGGAPVVAWETEPVSLSADDALAADRGNHGAASALNEAVNWLRDTLADGPRPAKEVKDAADRDGIKARTLDRAKARLRVVAAPDGYRGPWVWRLPDESTERQSAPNPPECATPGTVALCGSIGALCDTDADDEWGEI